MKVHQSLFSLVLLTFALVGNASHDVRFGQAAFGGSGCPELTPEGIRIDHENGEISYTPGAWILAGEVLEAKRINRAACNLGLPYALGPHKKLVITEHSQNGYAGTYGEMAKVVLSQEVFVSSEKGEELRMELQGDGDAYHIVQKTSQEGVCGGSGILRINSSALIQAMKNGSFAFAVLERIATKFEVVDCR